MVLEAINSSLSYQNMQKLSFKYLDVVNIMPKKLNLGIDDQGKTIDFEQKYQMKISCC